MPRISAADYFLLGLPAVFLVTLGIATLGHALPQWVGTAYVAVSALTFGFYGWDKRRARRDGWRVAESTLHLLELLGGWPGALIAQRIFRHKTRKVSFQIVFWLVVIAHLVAWGWLISRRF